MKDSANISCPVSQASASSPPEGGQFIGGHGMTPEAMLRTAAGLSCLWDGEPIKRVRAAMARQYCQVAGSHCT